MKTKSLAIKQPMSSIELKRKIKFKEQPILAVLPREQLLARPFAEVIFNITNKSRMLLIWLVSAQLVRWFDPNRLPQERDEFENIEIRRGHWM